MCGEVLCDFMQCVTSFMIKASTFCFCGHSVCKWQNWACQRTTERRFFDDIWTMKTEKQVPVEQQSLGNKIILWINHERKLGQILNFFLNQNVVSCLTRYMYLLSLETLDRTKQKLLLLKQKRPKTFYDPNGFNFSKFTDAIMSRLTARLCLILGEQMNGFDWSCQWTDSGSECTR